MTLAEHIIWARRRALAFLDENRPADAVNSIVLDMSTFVSREPMLPPIWSKHAKAAVDTPAGLERIRAMITALASNPRGDRIASPCDFPRVSSDRIYPALKPCSVCGQPAETMLCPFSPI